MGVHGQLGLFSTESAQQTSVMENAPVTSALSLEVTFNNSPSENKLSPILESIRKEIAKINGELKNFSLVEEKP